MADRASGVREGLKGGEGSATPAGRAQDVVVVPPQDTICSASSKGGRPRKDGLPSGSAEALAADTLKARQRRVSHRQRVDVRKLARVGGELLDRKDYGAGKAGSPAAAFGTLTRAMKDVHEMERRQYGLDQEVTRPVAVILLPVAASDMAAWQAESVRLLGSQPRPDASMAVRPGFRVIEDDIVGEPADEVAP